MPTHTTFANTSKIPATGSIYPIGTAFLRSDPPLVTGDDRWIAVGKTEKISMKTTGTEIELEDEEGATEAFIMLNNGEDVSLTARFTRDVPSPVRGQFITISRRKVTLSRGTRAFTGVATGGVGFVGKAKFTLTDTSQYLVGELVSVVTSTNSPYRTTAQVLAIDPTSLTLDIPFTVTATGTLSAPTASYATQVINTVQDTFLITEVSEDYGSKEVAKYSITGRKWDSISNTTSSVATVATATSQLLSKGAVPL